MLGMANRITVEYYQSGQCQKHCFGLCYETHHMALPNILYVAVSKQTVALQASAVPAAFCFSLLTSGIVFFTVDASGANSKLESDVVILCLSFCLDQVHTMGEWQSLYKHNTNISNNNEQQ